MLNALHINLCDKHCYCHLTDGNTEASKVKFLAQSQTDGVSINLNFIPGFPFSEFRLYLSI